MWFALVKELFHPFSCVLRHILKTCMLKPMLGGVFSEWNFVQAVSGAASIQVQ